MILNFVFICNMFFKSAWLGLWGALNWAVNLSFSFKILYCLPKPKQGWYIFSKYIEDFVYKCFLCFLILFKLFYRTKMYTSFLEDTYICSCKELSNRIRKDSNRSTCYPFLSWFSYFKQGVGSFHINMDSSIMYRSWTSFCSSLLIAKHIFRIGFLLCWSVHVK